ncbi:hypothetical protein FJZ20_01100 [Candidatus Pacearchaeota archaeon]|nr:hypothetical protein [Candidatus Pacearchaeota archaeon]
MKALKPSSREKKRYLLVRGKIKDIEKCVLDGIGILGMSKTALRFITIKGEKAIISMNREAVDSVRACFAIWPEKIEVERVSGTLKGLGRKL